MKVVCPFTRVHPTTRFALKNYDVQYVPMEGIDGYRRLMRRLWYAREPVIIVEHDVVPWPGALEELWQCPGAWCANSYPMNGGGPGIVHGLGCTKLSVQLMEAVPTVWDEPVHWSLLDQKLFFAAREVGLEPHRHRPDVTHLHDY